MAFKTFAPGVLTSSDVNTFLMRQAVITCTSSTRPSSPSEGMTIYETDTDLYKVYNGSNWIDQGVSAATWTSYTPTMTGWTPGDGTFASVKYMQIGGMVFYKGAWTFGSTSAVSATVSPSITLPVTAAEPLSHPIGETVWRDAGAGADLQGVAVAASTTTALLYRLVPLASVNSHLEHQGWFTGSSTPLGFTFAAGDVIKWNLRYEAA